MKIQETDLLSAGDLSRIFGVSRRTAQRWIQYGTRPEIIAIARLIKSGDLGAIASNWRGWRIVKGRLYDPLGDALRGWAPEHVRCLPWLHELAQTRQHAAYVRKLASMEDPTDTDTAPKPRTPLRPQPDSGSNRPEPEPCQLPTLARLRQPERRQNDRRKLVPWVAPFAFSGPVTVRIAPWLDEGQSRPSHKRARK